MTDLIMQDGVYPAMPPDQYHALERFSASGIMAMLVSPATYWKGSFMDPDRDDEDDDTPARILGRAYHTARLEPHLFDDLFACELDPEDFPDALTTATQIGDALAELGQTKKKQGEKVIEQAQRLVGAGYKGKIWHLMQARWEAQKGNREGIAPKYFKQIHADMDAIKNTPAVARRLSNGFAEVTVLWTDEETGVKMKARIDYLTQDGITDFKTFENKSRKQLDQCLADDFRYNRYYIQAMLYWRAAEMIRTGALTVMGDAESSHNYSFGEFVEGLQSRKTPLDCHYVWQEKKGVPNLLVRQIHLLTKPHASAMHNAGGASEEAQEKVAAATQKLSLLGYRAQVEIKNAIRNFDFYSETYERGQPWRPVTPEGDIDDDSFSSYWLDMEAN